MKIKNAKHTPGPLKAVKCFQNNGPEYFIVTDKSFGGKVAATCTNESDAILYASAPELLAALEAQEAAFSERSMTIHYQDSEERAKTYDQKKAAHDNYLESATKADELQDKATELRRAAIARAKGE